ncbi:MAG: diphosphate--fructose-6-phosphate 1-phosphotransferase [Pseudomonadota bacterium]|nr:diphosphate--fructose-6-phosphate 1-phosphotransferase [Pseudomonadota bacterium]
MNSQTSLPSLCIVHSGGATSVLNTTASAIIQEARQSGISAVYAARFGLQGLLEGQFYNTHNLTTYQLKQLKSTPGSLFGTTRKKLPSIDCDPQPYRQLFSHLDALNIGYLLYQGGNDSQDTVYKINQAAQKLTHPLVCIGLPKTIDNDLFGTDFSPGFPSAATYLQTSLCEASYDLASVAANSSSTQVLIMEVMGRNAGWLAASTGCATHHYPHAPHMILMPERPVNLTQWARAVQSIVNTKGFAVVVAAEGIKDATTGKPLSALTGKVDAFSHPQLGGAGHTLAQILRSTHGLKVHVVTPDFCQRSAVHLRSSIDVTLSEKLGHEAVRLVLNGQGNCMLGIQRIPSSASEKPLWHVTQEPLSNAANHEKGVPDSFIDESGYHVTQEARDYFSPLLELDHLNFERPLPFLSPSACGDIVELGSPITSNSVV